MQIRIISKKSKNEYKTNANNVQLPRESVQLSASVVRTAVETLKGRHANLTCRSDQAPRAMAVNHHCSILFLWKYILKWTCMFTLANTHEIRLWLAKSTVLSAFHDACSWGVSLSKEPPWLLLVSHWSQPESLIKIQVHWAYTFQNLLGRALPGPRISPKRFKSVSVRVYIMYGVCSRQGTLRMGQRKQQAVRKCDNLLLRFAEESYGNNDSMKMQDMISVCKVREGKGSHKPSLCFPLQYVGLVSLPMIGFFSLDYPHKFPHLLPPAVKMKPLVSKRSVPVFNFCFWLECPWKFPSLALHHAAAASCTLLGPRLLQVNLFRCHQLSE